MLQKMLLGRNEGGKWGPLKSKGCVGLEGYNVHSFFKSFLL